MERSHLIPALWAAEPENRTHELGLAVTLCSRGAHPFVLGILTQCGGFLHPTASPVRSSIPLTPTRHHGNTGSRLSQR